MSIKVDYIDSYTHIVVVLIASSREASKYFVDFEIFS